jgi:hypothetical protein
LFCLSPQFAAVSVRVAQPDERSRSLRVDEAKIHEPSAPLPQ